MSLTSLLVAFHIRCRNIVSAFPVVDTHRYISNTAYSDGNRSANRQPKTYVKPEAEITVFELLMMGGMSPETC
jgi:hypothetical protein